MSSEIAIRVKGVSKQFLMYDRPEDRLKQMIMPKVRSLMDLKPKRYFKEFSAVHGVNLEIRRGETVGIIGRNGSGKSTLLQMICGTLTPTAGTIKVNGRVAALLELGAGFDPNFTGRENVYLNSAILGLSRKETDARFAAIARFADIGMFMDHPVKTYSSGMYVRLAFAVAINVEPDILIVDEALSVGDEAFQRKCFARIEQIRENGATILFVSHGAQTIVQLCDRAILMDKGEVLLDGVPRKVVSQYQRLVNLQGDALAEVREALKSMDVSADPQTDELPASTDQVQADVVALHPAAVQAQDANHDLDAALEVFDRSLISESRVEYEPNGASISDLRIENADGKHVNTLALGRTYKVKFVVEFYESADVVEIGHHYSTAEGMHLGGRFVTKEEEPSLSSVVAGTKLEVCFEFKCRLVPKGYMLSVGVRGTKNGEWLYLARTVDAVLFRVLTSKPIYFGGHFDFEMKPNVTELTVRRLVHARKN